MARVDLWPPSELALAAELRTKGGMSSSQIARALGRTRNSVIGALHRAGVPAPARPERTACAPPRLALRRFTWEHPDV